MKTLVSAAAVTALAGSAFGLGESLDRSNTTIWTVDTPGITMTATPLDSVQSIALTPVTTYDSMSGGAGFLASAPATGLIGFEDYGTTDSVPPNSTIGVAKKGLHGFGFAGGAAAGDGLTTGGTIIFFDFFDGAFNLMASVGIQLPQTGNFLWNIGVSNPRATKIPVNGIMTATTDDGTFDANGLATLGQWFLSDIGAAPLVGHNDTTVDVGSFNYGTTTTPDVRPIGYLFDLKVPTPGAAALMGIAGIAGLRRRR